MIKGKFKYNPKTLSYELVKRTVGEKLLRGFIFIAPTLVLSLVFGFIIAYQIESPNQRQSEKELADLKYQFKEVQERLALIDKVTEIIKSRDEDLYRTAFGASAFPEELRTMGVGGSDAYASFRRMSNAEMLIETFSKLDEIERKLHAQSISFNELVELAKENEKRLAHLPAIMPMRNVDLKRAASGYGWRTDPIYGTQKMHWGLDFTADVGTEVFATADGKVIVVKENSWGYGREVVIDHGYGYRTRYAHLSAFRVKEGQTIKRGDLVGLVGNTGKSTGPHLHYEVEQNGEKVNPLGFFHSDLSPEQYEELVKISNNAMKTMD